MSINLIASTIGGLFSSFIFGTYLDGEKIDFRVVMWGMSSAALLASFFIWRMKEHTSFHIKEITQVSLSNSFFSPLKDSLFVRV